MPPPCRRFMPTWTRTGARPSRRRRCRGIPPGRRESSCRDKECAAAPGRRQPRPSRTKTTTSRLSGGTATLTSGGDFRRRHKQGLRRLMACWVVLRGQPRAVTDLAGEGRRGDGGGPRSPAEVEGACRRSLELPRCRRSSSRMSWRDKVVSVDDILVGTNNRDRCNRARLYRFVSQPFACQVSYSAVQYCMFPHESFVTRTTPFSPRSLPRGYRDEIALFDVRRPLF